MHHHSHSDQSHDREGHGHLHAAIDLDAYLGRIGHVGERSPTLDTLRALLARHTEVIPFENLNPLLGWPVRLDAPALEQKLVRDSRGGYCFEHNLLLSHVLKALGYRVTGLGARVLWNVPEGTLTPRTHMLLLVDLGGQPYIADVGFGGQTLTGPLRLEPDTEQATPHEPFRLLRVGEDFVLQAKVRETWTPLYRFDLHEQRLPDYEVSNWYVSTHPASHFVTGLIAGRAAPGRRYALRNNELAVHSLNGSTERRVLHTAPELRQTLESAFRLTLPDAPELDTALARLTE
jgi:N-hydroxyarylamine O-acetyltransferase